MSSRDTHDLAGAIVGAAVGGLAAKHAGSDNHEILAAVAGGALGGIFGSRLPDTIEPATHPRHRSTAHSMMVAGGGLLVAHEAVPSFLDGWRSGRTFLTPGERVLGAFMRGAAIGAPAGYASHLALDATTPAGLPIFGGW